MATRESEPDRRYGLGRSLTPLAEALRGQGHEVVYVTRSIRGARGQNLANRLQRLLLPIARAYAGESSDTEAVLGALLERLDMGRLAAKIAMRDRFTHVHVHDPWMGCGLAMARKLQRGATYRWGLTEHGFGCYGDAVHEDGGRQSTSLALRLRQLERGVLSAAHWVVSPTSAALRQLARDLAVYPIPSSWHWIPHPRPAVRPYSRSEARRLLGWDPEGVYVLGVGRLAPLKRFDLLVRAVARVQSERQVRLVILGEGDVAWYQDLAHECGLKQPIHFAVTDDVGKYLAAANLYVSTSSTESFGLSNLEAIVAGTRSICTAVGGVPEVLGEAATLVPVSEDAIAVAIQYALDDERSNAEWRARCRSRSISWQSAEQVAQRYSQVFADCLASN